MSSGKCLCGRITWQIMGKPSAAYHCHCSMCRKAHGTAFASYYFMAAENFRWTNSPDSVMRFASSPRITRAFCKTCGSVVPDQYGNNVYVPAGCHDHGPMVDAHIFVGSKAAWFDITDGLPCHDQYPDGEGLPAYADKKYPDAVAGVIRGSCLCDAVAFAITEPFKVVHNCHCSRCRQARSAVHATNGFVAMSAVAFSKGRNRVCHYKLPSARFFTHAFCAVCGSGLPRIDPERKIAVVPFGALDDHPGCKPADHIHVASKARWYEITDDLPVYDEGPLS